MPRRSCSPKSLQRDFAATSRDPRHGLHIHFGFWSLRIADLLEDRARAAAAGGGAPALAAGRAGAAARSEQQRAGTCRARRGSPRSACRGFEEALALGVPNRQPRAGHRAAPAPCTRPLPAERCTACRGGAAAAARRHRGRGERQHHAGPGPARRPPHPRRAGPRELGAELDAVAQWRLRRWAADAAALAAPSTARAERADRQRARRGQRASPRCPC